MIYPKNNLFVETASPHSLGLANNMTIPNPGWDSNPLMISTKKFWGETRSNGTGFSGLGSMSFTDYLLYGGAAYLAYYLYKKYR